MRRLATRVLVVGGGPVGTTLATDLAWRGVDVIVAEQRHRGELPSVKCNHVAARTMEVFRRLGVVRRVRDAGMPHDHAMFSEAEFTSSAQDLDSVADAAVRVFLAAYATT